MNRRKFVKVTSIASATAVPVLGFLAYELNEERILKAAAQSFNDTLEFHIIDNNLLNLHFYFINVRRKGHAIKPFDENANSFMIVRLPQMHVSEKGYWVEDWKKPDKKFPDATLSGYSYLAFQLWPDKFAGSEKVKTLNPNKNLKFSLENVLDWNNENNFDLVTLVEWFDLKEKGKYELDFKDYTLTSCEEFRKSKIWFKDKQQVNEEFDREDNYYTKTVNEPKNSFNYRKYKSMVRNLLDGNFEQPDSTHNQFIPITFLEVPQSLCIVPISGKRDKDGKLLRVSKKFWPNKFVNQEKAEFGYRKYEVWNNTLFYKSETTETGKENVDKSFKIEVPSFRAIGVISKQFECPTQNDPCKFDCIKDKGNNFLPSLLDKTELAFLTQFAKKSAIESDFRSVKFDINEVNGLFFTGLGIITHLKYYNVEKKPVGVDLIEYEQVITQGRDIFIKVSRLGYNCKTGQRYKYVIEGKRKIQTEMIDPETGKVGYSFPEGPTSFIELKQYCECIDKYIVYNEETQIEDWSNRFNPLLVTLSAEILKPIRNNKIDHKRLPYTSLTVVEKKRIPIDCLQDQIVVKDVCQLENLLWFWPVIEGASPTDRAGCDVKLADYLPCEYFASDHEGQKITAATPFMFIRACLIEQNGTAEIKNLQQNYYSTECPNYIQRRKTYFNNQKIAFTPSLKNNIAANVGVLLNADLNVSKSKVNILETDFIETYFNIKDLKQEVDENHYPKRIGEVKYVLYPQMLRAKVFVDHIRDLTQQKIASVVEYHENYLEHEFIESIINPLDATKKQYANAAKQILANTDAFMHGKEELVNNEYEVIKNVLQKSKDKLGNLTVPDIIPDTISLEKFGITLPKDINDSIAKGKTVLTDASAALQKIASFNPRELLRGKLSDVCGLDLTAILDELLPVDDNGQNHTPLFEINKIANKITKEIEDSEVFKDIKNNIEKVKKKIEELENGVNEGSEGYRTFAKQINDKEHELADNLKQLSNYIPNANELDNYIKNKFEQFRTQAFESLLSELKFDDIRAKIDSVKINSAQFLEREMNLLTDEFQHKVKILSNYFEDYKKEIEILNLLPDEIKNLDATTLVQDYFNQVLGKLYDNTLNKFYKETDLQKRKTYCETLVETLFNTIAEIQFKIGNDVVYCVVNANNASVTFELTNQNTGTPLLIFEPTAVANGRYIQLEDKIKTLQTFIAKNVNGNLFQQQAAVQLQNLIVDYSTILDTVQKQVKEFQEIRLAKIVKHIEDWKKRTNVYINETVNLLPEVREAIIRIQDVVVKANFYIDFIRKFDPYFYYQSQQQLAKDIRDIETRFQQTIFDEIVTLENAIRGKMVEYVTKTVDYVKTIVPCQPAIFAETAIPSNILKDYNATKKELNDFKSNAIGILKTQANVIVNGYISKLNNAAVKAVYDKIYGDNNLIAEIETTKKKYQDKLLEYKKYVEEKIKSLGDDMVEQIVTFIDEHPDEIEKVKQAQNLYHLLTSIKQQDLTYNWATNRFRDINLGIVSFKKFSNPDTTLKVDVKATTYFTSGKFPPAIENVVFYSENRFTNFGISFFNCLTVSFNEISFISGSDHATHFDVKIKDVKFDGALSFVQAFEKWLQTMGKGLVLQLHGDHAALGYSLAIPAIKTPGFNIFNLSLNFDLRVYFDKRPLRFGFSMARPDSKFGIAVGIYAGFGFFGIVADPKNGIVEIDCALEAGAWAGISFGPFSGEVKLAFGFRYTKNEFGVRLEGYIVAEGRLSFWIVEVAARIYLGIVSENSYVEGVCTVTYSVKVGFIKKSFSGSFHKKIAGAKSNNNSESTEKIALLHEQLQTVSFITHFNATPKKSEPTARTEMAFKTIHEKLTAAYGDEEELVIEPVGEDEWADFITKF